MSEPNSTRRRGRPRNDAGGIPVSEYRTVRLSPQANESLDAIASIRRKSRTAVVAEIIAEYLDNYLRDSEPAAYREIENLLAVRRALPLTKKQSD